MKAGSENYKIQTVSLALDLLELFQGDEDELGISELSKRLNLHKNNVLRLAETLTAKNFLEKNNATEKYRLGIMTIVLWQVATRQIDFAFHVHPFLIDLKQKCQETCCFSVIRDGYTFYLDGVESDLPVRVVQRLGYSRPLYCTAAGRVQLACMPLEKRRELLTGSTLKGLTANTITDPDLLHNELINVAQKGYSIDDQEYDSGVVEIAAPVIDSYGVIIGALSIVGPVMRFTGTRIENELLQLVVKNAALLSKTFGNCRTKESLPKAEYKHQNRIEQQEHVKHKTVNTAVKKHREYRQASQQGLLRKED